MYINLYQKRGFYVRVADRSAQASIAPGSQVVFLLDTLLKPIALLCHSLCLRASAPT